MEPIDDAGARLELQIANLQHAADAIGKISTAGRECMRRSRTQSVGIPHGIIKTEGARTSAFADCGHAAA
jgi:hypothetical protein